MSENNRYKLVIEPKEKLLDLTIKLLAEIIQVNVGHRGPIVWDSSKPDGTPRKLMDVSKMAAQGWEAKIKLKDGIRETYEWYLENEDDVKKVTFH